MARAVAGGFIFFLALVVIAGVPATIGGFLGLTGLGLPAAIIFTFLLGFLVGTVKKQFLEDNVTTSIISLALIGFTTFFTQLVSWQSFLVFLVAYIAGRELSEAH